MLKPLAATLTDFQKLRIITVLYIYLNSPKEAELANLTEFVNQSEKRDCGEIHLQTNF